MSEPLEVFWSAWIRELGVDPGHDPLRATPDPAVCAQAASAAAAELILHLSQERGWSWINARIFTAKLVDRVVQWTLSGGSLVELRAHLREIWHTEQNLEQEEIEARRITASLLCGAGPISSGRP